MSQAIKTQVPRETRATSEGLRSQKSPWTPRFVVRLIVLTIIAIAFVSPIIFMIVTSYKTRADATSLPPGWIPDPFSLQAYAEIFSSSNTPVLRWFANSMIAALLHAVIVVTTATSD